MRLTNSDDRYGAVPQLLQLRPIIWRATEFSGDPRVIPNRGGSVAEQLTNLAQKEGADLMVAGAYGHSRLGEWLFGGVTRDLLSKSNSLSDVALMRHKEP
jgi:hypothetical protein